jgi:hypothetical protein
VGVPQTNTLRHVPSPMVNHLPSSYGELMGGRELSPALWPPLAAPEWSTSPVESGSSRYGGRGVKMSI